MLIMMLFVVCLQFNQAHAQRCLPGMRGIQLTGGLSDNMHWKNGCLLYTSPSPRDS